MQRRGIHRAWLLVLACSVLIGGAQAADVRKLVGTYYFYWYSTQPGVLGSNRIRNMTEHPPEDYLASSYTWADPAWHRRELQDIMAAGIDFILPVYWGDSTNSYWAQDGLPALVAAADELVRSGSTPPKIGMFYDTTALQVQFAGGQSGAAGPDLRTPDGKALFFRFIKEYYSQIPSRHWALLDGRPVIVFYVSTWVSGWDQSTFDYVVARFSAEFGVAPYLIRERSWTNVTTDDAYQWGAAVSGPVFTGRVAAVGPGYNDSNVPGRKPTIRDRECGAFYSRQWKSVISSAANVVLIETWNEFLEATEIAASKEWGRKFIELTAQNVARWKAAGPPQTPSLVWLALGRDSFESGLRPAFSRGDGVWRTTQAAGRDAAYADRTSTPPSYYIYLDVGDAFQHAAQSPAWITVEYLDGGANPWWIEYDGVNGAYTPSARVTPRGSGAWRRQSFYVPDAYFGGRENGGADLRLVTNFEGDANLFSRIWISKAALANEPPQLTAPRDVPVNAGESVELPVTASQPGGGPIALELSQTPAFASLRDGGGGNGVLRLAPAIVDSQACAYPVAVLATGSGRTPLQDAATVRVTVTTPPTLLLSYSALAFSSPEGSTATAPQTLGISNAAGTAFNWTATATTQSGGDWLRLAPASGSGKTDVQVTANPAGLAAGTYRGTITVNAPGLALSTQNAAVTLTVTATVPSVSSGGIVNNASYAAAVAPGTIAAVFGSNLTDGSSCVAPQCNPAFENGKLTTTMAGAQVSINGNPVPIYYATPGQIGIQIPSELSPGVATLQVAVGGRTGTAVTIAVDAVAPGIFSVGGDGRGMGAFTHADSTPVTPEDPAHPGEIVILYATGLGAVSPVVSTGTLPAGETRATEEVRVSVDGMTVLPEFAGLAGCCVGLNQVNFRVHPSTRSGGSIPVFFTIAGRQSNTVTIAVQ